MSNMLLQETIGKKCKFSMVYILAAISVHHAIDALCPEQQSKYKNKVYANPGLNHNPRKENPIKIVQNLLSKDLKDKIEIVV